MQAIVSIFEFFTISIKIQHHFIGNLVCWGGVARLAVSIISDQEKRDKFVTEAFNGAQKVWGSWENDGFMNEGI